MIARSGSVIDRLTVDGDTPSARHRATSLDTVLSSIAARRRYRHRRGPAGTKYLCALFLWEKSPLPRIDQINLTKKFHFGTSLEPRQEHTAASGFNERFTTIA
jgi:hypothetical protein